MNNSDFQRLLLTNDKELVSELTKPKRKDGRGKGKGKGEGKGGSENKSKFQRREKKKQDKAEEAAEPASNNNKYRDRAKERRELSNEYEKIATEFENHGEVSVDQSKYLGGDLDHTHLVKGLDYALLTKVRTELTKQHKVDELQKLRSDRKQQKKERAFASDLGRKVWRTLVETLHPHHSTFKQRVDKMGKAISMGQRIRGATSVFLPGRMCYEFDTGISMGKTDIPRIVYISKEDAPSIDGSKKVASLLPESVEQVRSAFQRATEVRKQRKLEKTQVTEASYAVAQKIVTKHKAKDLEEDIFQGAGGFDLTELARRQLRKDKAAQEAKPRDAAASAAGKPSYFADAGAEKYQEAPKGQLELAEIEVEEREGDGPEDDSAVAFEASDKFTGSRPGWVFKLGAQGLGYYRDIRPAAASGSGSGAKATSSGRSSLRKAAKPAVPPPDEDDAYGECFPSTNMGHALVFTGDNDSDAEAEEEGKKRRANLGKKKGDGKGDGGEDSVTANQKQAGKKRKLTENQQWQKIDNMIKKGKHSSIDELEASMRSNRKNPPMPREIMSTPAYF